MQTTAPPPASPAPPAPPAGMADAIVDEITTAASRLLTAITADTADTRDGAAVGLDAAGRMLAATDRLTAGVVEVLARSDHRAVQRRTRVVDVSVAAGGRGAHRRR